MKLAEMYERDELAWRERTVHLIRQERYGDLDHRNLGEFLLDMAVSERHQVENRLTVLLVHLLKWDYQPEWRLRSWELTIKEQRRALRKKLSHRGTLRNYAKQILATAYADAVGDAVIVTGLKKEQFPQSCPYDMEFLLQDENGGA